MKKTSRTFKRFAAITSASLLAACAVAPVTTSAVDITINETETNHKYSAYQIFNATVKGTELTGITWGENVTGNEDAILDAINALEYKVDGTDILNGIDDPVDLATALSNLADGTKNEYSLTDKIASIFAENVSGTPATATYDEGYKLAINDEKTGYYLVIDEKADASKEGYVTASKYILKVVGDGEIEVKKDAPTVMKKIKENTKSATGAPSFDGSEIDNSYYNDTADYCIGDAVPFKLYGSLPSTLDNYQKGYKYVFHDKLDTQFNAPENVVVKIKVGETEYYVKSAASDTDKTGYWRIDGTAVGGVTEYTFAFADIKSVNLYTDAACENQAMTEDPTPVAIRPNADSVVTIEYTAVLNSNADIGQPGQQNEVYLEFSSDSNWDGEDTPETSESIKDYVAAFTYELDLTKLDNEDKNLKLGGAKFVLTRTVNGTKQYAVLDGDNKIKNWVTGTPTIDTKKGTITGTWTPVNATAETGLVPTVVTSSETDGDGKGGFKFVGIDDGTYEVLEILAPKGYKIPDDGKTFTFVVSADTTNSQNAGDPGIIAGTVLTSLKLTDGTEELDTGKQETGILAASITNTSSSTLPSTGGIGTTVFYLGGGAMVAVAGIYLISKKRMKNTQE